MPLPNPDYLTPEPFYWDGQVFPSALLTSDGSVTGIKRIIRWGALDSIDRKIVHELIMQYATRQSLSETLALTVTTGEAFHVINYNGQLSGGLNAGLNTGVTYEAQINVNGTINQISILGVATDTITDVITKINAQLTGAIASVNSDFNLEISTTGKGNTQNVVISVQNLFLALGNGLYNTVEEPRVGINDINDVFDLNFRGNYAPYTELLIGKLRYSPNKTLRSAKTTNDMYFNHGSKAWLYIATDTTTPAP